MVNGIGITKEGSYTGMMDIINKRLKGFQKLRPSLDFYQVRAHGYGSYSVKGGPAGYIPYYQIGSQRMETLAFQSDIFMTVINALRNKIFRRGFKIEEKVENPDELQLKVLNESLRRINANNQSIRDVLRIFEQDENIYDDGYLIAINDYIFASNGDILDAKTKEIIRASPTVMAVIADSEGRLGYTLEGKRVFVSVTNRGTLVTEDEAASKGMKDAQGIKLQPAFYRGITYYGNESRDIFYIPGEVLHLSKHNPTAINGVSPMFSIWMKMVTLIEQDRYLLLNYQKGRPPRGILAISTTNFASTQAMWEAAKVEARKDPHSINPLLIENKEGKGGKAVEWIELMKPLGDMQFIESRNEMRRGIGARYGVMPLFSGDLTQSGGLNNEGLQITVTNQAVEEGQKMYNEKVFPWILERFEIFDYTLELQEPEEKDEVIDAKIRGIKIDNAVKMTQMGFDVNYNKVNDEFEFSEEATAPTEQTGIFGGSKETKLNDPKLEKGFFTILSTQQERDLEKDAYDMIMDDASELEKEGLEFVIQKQDKGLRKFISQDIFKRKFEGLSKTKSNKIRSILLKSILAKDSLTEVINKIKDAGVGDEQAELIARTESNVLKNATREFNFTRVKGAEDFVYKWVGPNDNRTADVSKEIKRKSAKGLKLEKLKSLVRKTSESFGFSPDRDWFSHPNQRHTFTRVI
ncbi:MAG: hypothetical protein KJI69_05620 [Patescibacteria group bacterium]|nr:hypothetical protein [Patescibacteria group bacterium]